MKMFFILFVLMWGDMEGCLAFPGEQINSAVLLDKMIT